MTDDTISRQAAIDAINKALDRETLLNSFVRKVAVDAVKELPPAQPECEDAATCTKYEQVECEDAVSRESVLDEIHRYMEERDYTIGLLHDNVCGLPPVTPKQPGWIPCKTALPTDFQWYYATCKSLVDNRENWVFEGCYTPWEHFNSTPMIRCGKAEVIAWMPKEIPGPWEGGTE